jgi:hypothetical protein
LRPETAASLVKRGARDYSFAMTRTTFLENLTPALFWDVDRATVDPEKHSRFIIPRIMDRGTREDVREVMRFYGNDVVREVLLTAPALHKKTIAYFACKFDVPRDHFRAYRKTSPTWSA